MADKSAYLASQMGQIMTAVLKKMAAEKSKVSSASITEYLGKQ